MSHAPAKRPQEAEQRRCGGGTQIIRVSGHSLPDNAARANADMRHDIQGIVVTAPMRGGGDRVLSRGDLLREVARRL